MCIVSTAIGWIGQSNLLKNFANYEQSEQTLVRVADLDQDVQELKAHSEKYLSTGTTSKLETALALQKSLVERIETASQPSDAAPLTPTLLEMKKSLIAFHDQLDRASQERDLRTSLVLEDLPAQYQKVEATIGSLRSQLQTDSSDARDQVFDLTQSHASSYRALQEYFIEPDSVAFDTALIGIAKSRSIANSIDKNKASKQISNLCKSLDQQLVEFKKLGTRAFQATRGYMYYSNVVMAGEISEFAHLSNRLKKLVGQQRDENQMRRAISTNRSRLFALLASLTAVGFAVWMAARLSYLIVVPISLITETFRKLGQGETVDEIPALDREDEIGRMARAARIFNEKNLETRELLKRSQELTSELATKARDLELTNQELDNFAYIASHDLKSPLRGINHLAQWVQEDCGDALPDESRLHLQQMQKRVTKMDRLLSELLEYSRAGRIDPTPELIDIGSLIASIISIIDKPPGFRINLMTPSFQFHSFKTPLNQVLMNLITNGVKYNDKDGVGKIEIHSHRKGDRVHFMISDNGRGIDPKYHEKVFEMYQRVASDVVDGTGMGLAIVKKQVEKHGGVIQLSSEEGDGATFSFSWPVTDEPADNDPSSVEPTNGESANGERANKPSLDDSTIKPSQS